jgi:hypothetical protein
MRELVTLTGPEGLCLPLIPARDLSAKFVREAKAGDPALRRWLVD